MSDDKKTTRTVYHPEFPNHSREVLMKDAEAWKEAGWRLTEPKKGKDADKEPAPAATDVNVTIAKG